jgi:hypothetical protein
MPRAGNAADVPWAGDLVREAPTCTCDERLGDVTDRMRRSSDDFCLVILAEQKIVLGLLRGDGLIKDPNARVEDVMELGPKTTRPSEPLQELIESNDAVGVKHFFVATSHGALLGVLDRDTADRAVATWRKGEEGA